MNLKRATDLALMLINSYSEDGTLIGESDNADYLKKINGLANDAQMELTRIRQLKGTKQIIQSSSDENGYNTYSMNSDFLELRNIKLNNYPFLDYILIDKKVLIPKEYDGTFIIYYYKNPETIDEYTPKEYEFELDIDVQPLIPFYIAAHLIMFSRADIAIQLLNEYEAKKELIRNYGDTEFRTIINTTGW